MPAPAFGLYGHIRNNRIRSWFLLGGLFLLAYLLTFGVILIGYGQAGVPYGASLFGESFWVFLTALPFVTAATALWVFIGYRFNVAMINGMTGARPLAQQDNPKLHSMLETLCISRGMTTPKLAILDTDALNAFASGVNDKQYTVTVTSGLLNNLNDEEVEAVLAHELTHIRNGDVKLMIIAVVIAGVVSLVGELAFRGLARGGMRSSSSSDRKGSGAIVLLGLAMVAIAWFLAIVVRLSLSRAREYLADAGAVELTKNPDAMISALLKISGRADIPNVASGVMDMCFENDPDDLGDLFSTHPSITKRVQALVDMAGGRMPDMPPHPLAIDQRQDLPTMVQEHSHWGARRPR
ncbi:M48 family metallopeptidase [Phreatobacter sp.]|uniref:M48 family metallopeptidase n=1 Tax=Phreatobacter sp. TaxID=1966341 RepID=UPI003F6FDCF5